MPPLHVLEHTVRVSVARGFDLVLMLLIPARIRMLHHMVQTTQHIHVPWFYFAEEITFLLSCVGGPRRALRMPPARGTQFRESR